MYMLLVAKTQVMMPMLGPRTHQSHLLDDTGAVQADWQACPCLSAAQGVAALPCLHKTCQAHQEC